MDKLTGIFTGIEEEIAGLRQSDPDAGTIFEGVQADIDTLRGVGHAPVRSVFEGLDEEIAALRNAE